MFEFKGFFFNKYFFNNNKFNRSCYLFFHWLKVELRVYVNNDLNEQVFNNYKKKLVGPTQHVHQVNCTKYDLIAHIL
jgi:hypothetical protein